MKTPSMDLGGAQAVVSRREWMRWFGVAGAGALLAGGTGRLGAAPGEAAALPSGLLGAQQQPGHYRFTIGSFEAVAFNDGSIEPSLGEGPFGIGRPREELAAELEKAFLPADRTAIPFNVLLVRMGAELVLIDAGCGGVMGEAGGKLVGRMMSVGIRPEQITAVIITHAHGDHIGGLIDAKTNEVVFPNARHVIHRREYDYWMAPSPDVSAMKMPPAAAKEFVAGVQKLLGALKGRIELVAPGDKTITGLELIDAPGHTPGHMLALLTSGNDSLFHFVDVVHHHVLSFAHPEWLLAFDSVPEQGVATRRKILDRAAADRLRVFGPHMPFPALGHVRTSKTGAYEYVMAPWSVG